MMKGIRNTNWGLMMERSRSRLNPIDRLNVNDRNLKRDIVSIRNADKSLPDWITLTLIGAWAWFGLPEEVPAAWRDSSGIVYLRGVIKSGTIPSNVAILPVGLRPGGKKRFSVVSNNAFGYVYITSDGVITLGAGSNVYVDLAGVCFRAEG
jgi:hypothetical protein